MCGLPAWRLSVPSAKEGIAGICVFHSHFGRRFRKGAESCPGGPTCVDRKMSPRCRNGPSALWRNGAKAGMPRVASVSGTSRPHELTVRAVGCKSLCFLARRFVDLVADIVNDFQSGSFGACRLEGKGWKCFAAKEGTHHPGSVIPNSSTILSKAARTQSAVDGLRVASVHCPGDGP